MQYSVLFSIIHVYVVCQLQSSMYIYFGTVPASTAGFHNNNNTMWWGYTGGVKRVILSFLSYYSILFGITAHFYHVTPHLDHIIGHFYHVIQHFWRVIQQLGQVIQRLFC
jgi:hypothetical protein